MLLPPLLSLFFLSPSSLLSCKERSGSEIWSRRWIHSHYQKARRSRAINCLAFGVTQTYAWSSWRASRLGGSGKRDGREGELVRREEEWERERERERRACVCYYPQHVCVWCRHRHFPSVRLDPVREQFQDHSNTGEKILNQCFRRLLKAGLAFDAATSSESERKRQKKTCTRKQSLSPSAPPLSFSPSPFCFSCHLSFFSLLPFHCLPLSLSHLACLKIQRPPPVPPRCKGVRNFDMCVTFSSARLEEES